MGLFECIDLGVEIGQGLSARHEIGDLLPGLFAAHEVRSQGAADQHCVVIADGHRMGDLVGDEDHCEASLAGLQDYAQHVRSLLHPKRRGGFVEDQHPGSKMNRPRDRERLPLAAREAADQSVAVIDPRDPESLNRLHRGFIGSLAVEDLEGAKTLSWLDTDEERPSDGHQRKGSAELMDRGDAFICGVLGVAEGDFPAIHVDFARGRFVHPREDLDQRRLARAVVA